MTKKKKKDTEVKVAELANPFGKVSTMMQDLNKHYGKDLVKYGKAMPKVYKMPYNEPALDYASDGGIIIGRMNEVLGDFHSGKTRNSLVAMANFQKFCFSCYTPNVLNAVWTLDKNGAPSLTKCKCSNCDTPMTKVQVMVDIEGTSDPKFMKLMGIDTDGVIYSRPDMPSQAVGMIDAFLRMPEIGLILLDSIGSMGSDKEVVTAIEDEKMNQNALFFNKAIRKWQMALNSNTNATGLENGTTMIIVNQSYVTLSIYSKEVAQGGRGLRHGKALSLKTRIREKNRDKASGQVYGVHIQMTNEKNKAGMPYRRVEYYLNLDPKNPEMGYCQTNVKQQYIELALGMGLIEQKGSWFFYGDQKWQGKTELIEAFNEDMKKTIDDVLYHKE